MKDLYTDFRTEHFDYYLNCSRPHVKKLYERVMPILDASYRDGMSAYEMKALQYRVIAAETQPILFKTNPFYYETGGIPGYSDGTRDFRGDKHPGGWTHWRNAHLFSELAGQETNALRDAQGDERLYLICGPYCDVSQHFNMNYKPILRNGLRGLYEKAANLLEIEKSYENPNPVHIDYLTATMEGMLALKVISEKFSILAKERISLAESETELKYLSRIADSASYTPWNAPRTFYEALNLLGFMRKAASSLEGIGFNTFGRPDVELLPFYEADLAAGRLTKDEAYDLICRFLLSFDCNYDHDMKMVGYADHEFENTYTLGGCDAEGNPVWNDLTEMFLRATREEKIIYPKIKCRYSEQSPKEYLDAINEDVIRGTSSILFQNDNACIPALLRYGRTIEEARDYIVSGCWELSSQGVDKADCGNYVNLLKAFEFSIHRRADKIKMVGIDFQYIDEAKSFDEVYAITLANFDALFRMRAEIGLRGKGSWSLVDPLPILSAPMESCLDKVTDYTAGGAKYGDEKYELVGFPNIVDSLLAIKRLCFDTGKYTLKELLTAVRANWEGYEHIRQDCIEGACWGDESEESCRMAAKLNEDLFQLADKLPPTIWGGKVQVGHLTYTEIRFWAEETLATPDGRYNGEYFSQGLTPSRLHKIPSVTSVINSLMHLDGSKMAANSVVNVILPSVAGKMTLDICEIFLRVAATSAMQSLQLNCVTKEELLDAQKHPEKYPNLIVRVCGFSARFTALSPEWQQEILSRNFYD